MATLHQHVRVLQAETGELRQKGFSRALDEATRVKQKQATTGLLAALRDAGFAWRDVARIVGVSVPAVQKWRRGEGIDPANHTVLARLVALLDILREDVILDPVSWLETDVRPGVHLSKMELLAAGRFDLVQEFADDRTDHAGVDAILDRFEPLWRDRFVDEHFEVFTADDGNRSIRARW